MNAFPAPVLRLVTHINREALTDLQRNFPEGYALIEESRRRVILGSILRVIEEGKAKGVLRADVDGLLAAHILIGAVSHLSEPDVSAAVNLPLSRMLTEVITLLWEGMLAPQPAFPAP